MPDLTAFARRIRRRGRMVEKGANKAVIETAIVIDQAVVIATPVDTGRARANWQVGLGVPVTEATEDTDQGGQGTITKNGATIRARQPKQNIYISNNVNYIEALNDGSSSQAPANFVGIAVRAGLAFLRTRRALTR